jgi:DNA primase
MKEPSAGGHKTKNDPARRTPVSSRSDRSNLGNIIPARTDLDTLLCTYQAALPDSRGARYLLERRIPLELARRYKLGYAAPSKWAHPTRDWTQGRLVFPQTDPSGQLVNLYGRAAGDAPKEYRHDHLPGTKGYFNASALILGEGPLFVTEGPFDALSVIASGHRRTVAIFGVNGWRWEWAKYVGEIVLALDTDIRGQEAARYLAREALLRGKKASLLTAEDYGGLKDANEAWVAGLLFRSQVVGQ